MRRKELERLKRINATPKMIRMAQNNILPFPVKKGEDWREKEFTTRYDMMIRCQTRGQYLMVCLFFPRLIAQGQTTPSYEIYINPEGHQFETRILPGPGKPPKWSSAKIDNLEMVFTETLIWDYWEYGKEFIDSRIWINRDGRETLKRYLKTKESGWRAVKEFQDKCRDEQIKLAEEREKEPWDKDMALVPKELPGFERWSKHEAQKDTFIFYDSVKSKEGYCSYCEKMVPIGKPKHRKETKCSSCGRKAYFWLNTYRHTTKPTSWNTVCIQPIKGGFVIRKFYNTMRFYRNKLDPTITHSEHTRIICQGNDVRKYEYGEYKGKEIRWNDAKKYGGGYISGKLYYGNKRGLKNGPLKHSTVFEWTKDRPTENVYEYLMLEKEHPFIEQLVKIGMKRLTRELMQRYSVSQYLDEKKTDICGILRIDKARLKRLKAMDAGLNALLWIQIEKMEDTIYPEGMIEDLQSVGSPSVFGFLPAPHDYKKIWRYLKRQEEKSNEGMYQLMTTWRDYYNLAEQEKWNVAAKQIGWPKDVVNAHMEVILAARGRSIKDQATRLEKKWPKVNEILPKTKKFEFKKGKYQIVAATCIEDMVREGIALSHCMDKADFYYDRIEKYEAYPFFLRKTDHPDKPWYTLEVESSGNIRQKRTTGDNQNPDLDEAIPFLREWQRYFKSKMTPEEVQYGILANQKRIEEYKQLRKDEKKVWHGKLAGKLLADVLEADFMEAM